MEHSELVNQVFSTYAKNEPARALIGFISRLPKSTFYGMIEESLREQREFRSMVPIYESLAIVKLLQGESLTGVSRTPTRARPVRDPKGKNHLNQHDVDKGGI